MGYLKKDRSSDDTPKAKRSKQELLGLIEDHRNEPVPHIAPLPMLHLTATCGDTRCPTGSPARGASRCTSARIRGS